MNDERALEESLFTGLFRPLETANQPPAHVYKSHAWFERERRSLFLKAWHFVCLASGLSETGDYQTRDFVGLSIIVVRGNDHLLRAFFNTCRHRGAPLSDEASGRVKNFVCPFHRWSYRLDGQLFRAPGLDMSNTDSLCRIGGNLIELPCAIRENLVFGHLKTNPEIGIDAFLGNYLDNVARPHRTDRMRYSQPNLLA